MEQRLVWELEGVRDVVRGSGLAWLVPMLKLPKRECCTGVVPYGWALEKS